MEPYIPLTTFQILNKRYDKGRVFKELLLFHLFPAFHKYVFNILTTLSKWKKGTFRETERTAN